MSYENSAGLGVGQNYGVRTLGGGAGKLRTAGKEVQVTFEYGFDNMDQPFEVVLPKGARVIGADLQVDEAFAASSDATVAINGGVGIVADLSSITSEAISVGTLTNNPVTVDGWVLASTSSAEAIASATGKATLVVTYVKV